MWYGPYLKAPYPFSVSKSSALCIPVRLPSILKPHQHIYFSRIFVPHSPIRIYSSADIRVQVCHFNHVSKATKSEKFFSDHDV